MSLAIISTVVTVLYNITKYDTPVTVTTVM